MRLGKVASTTTVTYLGLNSSTKARTASSSWARLGVSRPSVAMLDPSTTTWWTVMACLAFGRGGPRSGVALGGGGPPGSPICRDAAGALRVARTALPDGGAGPHEGPSAGYFAGRRVDMVCSIGPGACQ